MSALTVGQTIDIMGGNTRMKIGTGEVQKLTKTYAVVKSSLYAEPVKYRLTGRPARGADHRRAG